jgi:hypothetical protein
MITAQRLVTALLTVTVSIGGLSGCAVHRPPDATESLSSGTPVPATGRPIWGGATPRAMLLGTDGTEEVGVLLSSRWFSPAGEVRTMAPDGSPVRWPPPVPVPAGVELRIPTLTHPTAVDVRLFQGAPDDNGVPTSEPHAIRCPETLPSPTATETGCHLKNDQDGVLVRLTNTSAYSMIVLYAEWYVPVAGRPAKATDNAVVSASWGFRTTTQQ